jgi:hypothetical protein
MTPAIELLEAELMETRLREAHRERVASAARRRRHSVGVPRTGLLTHRARYARYAVRLGGQV